MPRPAHVYFFAVGAIVSAGLAEMLRRDLRALASWEVWVWIAIVAGVDLLPVSVSRKLQLTLGFPLLLAVSLIYRPAVAALIAFAGSFDPREFRREVSIAR